MAAPRKISDAHLVVLKQVAHVRRTLPSDKDLSRITGLSVSAIKQYLSRFGRQSVA